MKQAVVETRSFPIDLSIPDNSGLQRGASRLKEALWYFVGDWLVRAHWMVSSAVRCAVLRWFGARIGRGVYAKPGLRVKFPWKLEVGDYTWLGEELWIDNLDKVSIGGHACVSQGVYLCTGNHDWRTRNLKLFTRPITIGDGAWVGARSVVGPGVRIGEGAILALASTVVKDIPAWEVHAGNPASFVKRREAPAGQGGVKR